MDRKTKEPETNEIFDKTLRGEDFDFDFDEDFESEVISEYTVMDAMRFDRDAGTASCNFEIDEDEVDAFGIPIKRQTDEDLEAEKVAAESNGKPKKVPGTGPSKKKMSSKSAKN